MLPCLSFLIQLGPLFFRLWLKLFAILPFFHQAMEASCILQRCITFFSFLLDRARSYLCHNSIHHQSFFCKLVSFLIAFLDEPFEERRLLHVLLGAVRFDMLDLDPYFF